MFQKLQHTFKKALSKNAPFLKYQEIDGWLTIHEANGLKNAAASLAPGSTIVEIGSWKGKSSYCLKYGLTSGTLYCIDPFNADGEGENKAIYENQKGDVHLLEHFCENLAMLQKPAVNVIPLVSYSKEFIDKIDLCNFLFIDGDHSIEGCKYDYENYHQKISKGGLLAFHDYDPTRKELGPTWVIENLVIPSGLYELYDNKDSLIVFKKIV